MGRESHGKLSVLAILTLLSVGYLLFHALSIHTLKIRLSLKLHSLGGWLGQVPGAQVDTFMWISQNLSHFQNNHFHHPQHIANNKVFVLSSKFHTPCICVQKNKKLYCIEQQMVLLLQMVSYLRK